jgi:hypothetical protein
VEQLDRSVHRLGLVVQLFQRERVVRLSAWLPLVGTL